MKIVIAGAGSIGCYCGALLAAGGQDVTLLGRSRILEPIRQQGLGATDLTGSEHVLAPQRLGLSEDPACLAEAGIVIVTVKSGATEAMGHLIRGNTPVSVPVLSWQNGIENARTLHRNLPGYDLRAGMVPFNVVPTQPGRYHRATSGDIVIESGPGDLAARLSVPGLLICESDRIEAVQWGKLVINLNNALNALSGLTLQQQLLDRGWRCLMADQMSEALAILKAAGHPVLSTAPLPAWALPHVLRLPTPLFSRVAARMLTIDPKARTSMAYDLMAQRPTEIDSLQGEIMRVAQSVNRSAPICARVSALIKTAPATPISVAEVRP